MGFYRRRWGGWRGRGGGKSKTTKKKPAVSQLLEPTTSRTRITRSNSGLSQPSTSTRVTRTNSALQRLQHLEEICSASESEDDFTVISDDEDASEHPSDADQTDSEDNPQERLINDDTNGDNHTQECSINAAGDDASFNVPSSVLSDSNDKQTTPGEHDDSGACFKSPFSIQRSSSLKMDEDFDIDKFIGNANREEEVTTTMSESGIGKEISDEDFLNMFPKVDLNKINQVKKPRATPKGRAVKGKKISITEYAIGNSTPKVESNMVTPSTSKANLGPLKRRLGKIAAKNRSIAEYAIPTSSTPVESDMATPSTSKGDRGSNSLAAKRRLGDLLSFDSDDIENKYSKKPKLETIPKSEKELDIKSRSPLKDKDINTEDDETDEEMLENLKDYEFPNLAEDINFDVSAIPSDVHTTFRGNVGEKRMETFLRERYLTNECVQKLHHSLTNIPVDAIERNPRGLMVPLMPHQRHALKWMRWREEQQPRGGILADDMGLGKTIQMISLILAAKNDRKEKARANGDNADTDDELDEDWGHAPDDESREIIDGRTLVVCPASVLRQWEREVHTKCRRGILRVFVYHGPCRSISVKQLAKYDIVVTTYHLIQQERELHIAPSSKKSSKLFKIKWERVILDEAHYIRNHQGKISISTCELSAKIKWALTGTPIQNKKLDFYALLKFLKCHPFDDIHLWRRWVGRDSEEATHRLQVITTTLMLRRTKAELIAKGAIQSLPERRFDLIEVDLDPEEKVVYQKLLLYSRTFFNEFLEQREDREHAKTFGCPRRRNIVQQEVPDKITRVLLILMKHHVEIDNYYILVLILRLRQMCCHPSLLKSMLDNRDVDLASTENPIENQTCREEVLKELDKLTSDNEDDEIDEEMAQQVMSRTNRVFDKDRRSSKVRAVLDVVHGVIEKGEKVIVVSQWTKFLDIIASNLCLMEGAHFEMFTGQVAVKNRQEIVDRLNDSDNKLNVLLLSLTAGGVGLNLVGANNLLLIDLHWNPQLETQAMDRIYRFGQENNVHIYKFVCRDTIEDKVKKLQDMKLAIANNVLSGSISHRLTIEDLKLLFS